MPKYPEAEKWKKAHRERIVIELFVEWCEEQGETVPSQRRLQDLFYDYYEIDSQKLEAERREMLEAHQRRHHAQG